MIDIRIPWAQPFVGDEEIAAVNRVMSEKRISMGAEVRAFENEVAAFVGRDHAVAVSNGTAAVELALGLLDIGRGDEVLVSALSHIATTNAIVVRGATPVFCDIDPTSLNIDPDDVATRIGPATRALLISDYCGSAVDYDRLRQVATRNGVEVVLDGAQSLGTTWRGDPTCSLTTLATTSFHTAKALYCGEGGMVFTDDPAVAKRARGLRQLGEVPGRKYVHQSLARNLRITDLAAAIGRVQLARVDSIRARRALISAWYAEALAPLSEVTTPRPLPECSPVWFSCPVLVPRRDRVADLLADAGIETRSLYPVPAYRQPIPEYVAFSGEFRPHTESACARVLNLPLFGEMTEADVQEVVESLGEALSEARLHPEYSQPVT